MSWSNLAYNQIVSDSDLLDACNTGVFAAKTNIPSTGLMNTSTSASDYAYVNVSGEFASNQLVTKDSLSAYQACIYGPYYFSVYAVDGLYVYKSTNGGFTYSKNTAEGGYGSSATSVAASSTGQYIAVGSNIVSNIIYISSNSGASFSQITFNSAPYPFNSTNYVYDIDMSANGQYIAVAVNTVPMSAGPSTNKGFVSVAVSNDYGATFSIYPSFYTPGNCYFTKVSVSGDGSHITYVSITSSRFSEDSIVYHSVNYGSSFTYNGLSTNQVFYDISLSYSGTYQLITNFGTASTGNLFVSYNGGSSFLSKSTLGGGTKCGMTNDGSSMYVTAGNGNIYYSTNTGNNWTSYPVTGKYTAIGAAVADYKPPSGSFGYYTSAWAYPSHTLAYMMYQSASFCTTQPYSATLFTNPSASNIFRKGYT
jgi:hypothetical protein